MERARRPFERFWVLQGVGWGVYAGGIFIDILAMPRARYPSAAAYEAVFLVSAFLSSFVLRAVCRTSLRREVGWPKTMLRAVVASGACAVPCGVLAEWASRAVRGLPAGPLLAASGSWGGVIYGTVVLMSWSGLYLGIKHYQLFEAAHDRARQAEALARSARLQALRLQLQPHFLFNTLNAISTLIVEGKSGAANQMLGQLAGFLRVTLEEPTAPEISLSQEVSKTNAYLAIEKARLADRLDVDVSIAPDAERALVPALLLQPLAENAIRHGIAPRPEGGRLAIRVSRDGMRIKIRVSDNGVGRIHGSARASRRGLGLANTLERLRVLYGNDHCLAVRWPDEGGCVVDIDLPYSTETSVSTRYRGETACAS
jgi:two-component system, LytTR family, sensor kinase